MLTWYKGNRPNSFLGFDDDTLLYKVYNEGNGWGWEWEYVPDMDGFDGYDTAEEAMAAAEADAESHDFDFDIDSDDLLLDLDLDLEEAYWDEVAHERMEIAKFGEW